MTPCALIRRFFPKNKGVMTMSSSTTRGRRRSRQPLPMATLIEIQPGQMSPLEYLLQRINDASVPPEVRDALAIAACPFVHPRAGYGVGKKAAAAEAAEAAGDATEWASDLQYDDSRPQ
jgi:hypothetical protein